MNSKNIIIGVLGIAAVIFGVLAFKQPTTVTVPSELKVDFSTLGSQLSQKAPVVNVSSPEVTVRPNINVSVPEMKALGAISSPDFPSRYFSVGGTKFNAGRMLMNTATTTLCAIQNTAATSSINSVSWIVTTGTSTAATIDIGTSTTAFSTTTNLVAATSLASGAQGTMTWRPVGGSVVDHLIYPNEYIVVKTAGAGLGGYTYGGRCEVFTTEL